MQTPLIHLVDDDAAVRDGLALLIGTVGLRVQTWAEPQAFIDGFDRQAIGAIVLDVRMPGLASAESIVRIGEGSQAPHSANKRSAAVLRFAEATTAN